MPQTMDSPDESEQERRSASAADEEEEQEAQRSHAAAAAANDETRDSADVADATYMPDKYMTLKLTPCPEHHGDKCAGIWATRLALYPNLNALLSQFRFRFMFGRDFVTTTVHAGPCCEAIVTDDDFREGGLYDAPDTLVGQVFYVHVDELEEFARLPPWGRIGLQTVVNEARQKPNSGMPSPPGPRFEWAQRGFFADARFDDQARLEAAGTLAQFPLSDIRSTSAAALVPAETRNIIRNAMSRHENNRLPVWHPQHVSLEGIDFSDAPSLPTRTYPDSQIQYLNIGVSNYKELEANAFSKSDGRPWAVITTPSLFKEELLFRRVPVWLVNDKLVGDYNNAVEIDSDAIMDVHPTPYPKLRNALRNNDFEAAAQEKTNQDLVEGQIGNASPFSGADAPIKVHHSEEPFPNPFEGEALRTDEVSVWVKFSVHGDDTIKTKINYRPSVQIQTSSDDFEKLIREKKALCTKDGKYITVEKYLKKSGFEMGMYVLPQGRDRTAHRWSKPDKLVIGNFVKEGMWPEKKEMFVEVVMEKKVESARGWEGKRAAKAPEIEAPKRRLRPGLAPRYDV